MKVAFRIFLALTVLTARANAFSLLGPYEDWMQTTNGFRQPNDIGGPMNLGEEYRWNVPVVVYAFDQTFLDYFGSNGVTAVEQAIQILNDLPSTSSAVLTNFPLDSTRVNYLAQSLNLQDLKSWTLSLLLEQMGLGQPERNVFDLRQWHPLFLMHPDELSWPDGVIPNLIIERNFDPEANTPSHWVNGTLYSGNVWWNGLTNGMLADVWEFPVDPLASTYTAVAGFSWGFGSFYTGLTRDDVGGLHYLLRTNNYNLEALLPGVHGIGPNAGNFVNQALRPGVDKITFVRRDFDELFGQFFPPFTNQFTDTYVTNNTLVQQQLERVVTEPDILFSCADMNDCGGAAPLVARTGTTNWLSSSPPGLAGPGVIRPPIRITLKKFGPAAAVSAYTSDLFPNGPAMVVDALWASFDGSTNSPIVYPNGLIQTTNQLTVRFWLHNGSAPAQKVCSWNLAVPADGHATLQAATHLTNWVTLGVVANRGTPVDWHHTRSLNQRFFRVVPE